jgi:cytochrome P450
MFVEPIADTVAGDARIPAGTAMMLLTRRAGLQDNRFARPHTFDPQRWLDGGQNARDNAAFLAFGAGPRFCPGRNLAFLETKTALAMLARNFEVSLDDSAGPVHERFGFTMAPQGLRVRLRERAVV